MKKVRLVFELMVVAAAAGCLEKPASTPGSSSTVLYRHHFTGGAQISRSTNSAKLSAILALPASREVREQTLDKLASTLPQLWQKFLPAGAAPQPMLFRPLLDDLLSAESYVEVRGPLGRCESVLAIELSDGRASLWRTNLSNIVVGWKLGQPAPITIASAKGWEAKKPDGPGLIQFLRSGNWVALGVGTERLKLLPELLEQISKNGRPVAAPTNALLELEADLPRLGDWLPAVGRSGLAPVHLTLLGKGDYLRTEARLQYSEALPWKYEPWSIPTNFIGDPLVTFTVGRGIAPLLSQVHGVGKLGLKSLPNQFCSWGPATIHADTFVTMPMVNPSNVLYQIGPKLPEVTTELLGQTIGGFTLISNRSELLWQGWPVLLPHLRAVHDGRTEYMLGGLFPLRPSTNRAPAEMYAQLKDRTNLVYYDWEITQEQLVHAKQLLQLWDIINHRLPASTNAPTQKWLQAVGPQLGNTVTEISLTSPKELSLVRRSDFGFTGFELVILARWLASPGFPWKLEPPHTPAAKTNAPKIGTNLFNVRTNPPPRALSPAAPNPKK